MAKVDCKVVLLGRHSVGKTCLAERYLNGDFNAKSQATIGAAFSATTVTIDNEDITLGIWDTAGAERYESMSRIYYRSAKAAIICYDLTDVESFDKVKLWVTELCESEPDCILYVVGTKVDRLSEAGVERGISALEARNYATQHGARYHETSAVSGKGIGELFRDVATHYAEQRRGTRPPEASNVQLEPAARPQQQQQQHRRKKKSGGGCCD